MIDEKTKKDASVAKHYFSGFADDYHGAFRKMANSPFQYVLNRFFRWKTFQKRTEIVVNILKNIGVSDKRILDIGCGSGEVSIEAAKLGAYVTGLDITPEMITIAKREADTLGLSSKTEFRVSNVFDDPLPAADVTLCIGVIEYYQNLEMILPLIARTAEEYVIIVDTYNPWWRRHIRHFFSKLKRFNIYYHDPALIQGIMKEQGFFSENYTVGHSFIVYIFKKMIRRENENRKK